MFLRAEKPLKRQLVRRFTLQNSYLKDWWRCLGLGSFDLGVVGGSQVEGMCSMFWREHFWTFVA